ncbi:hypothetical protein [Rhizobium sp.]|uniref:hypothetical protein n=1 Tax=Rhizobium sp. TaxID=391 RepID=UPI0034C6C4D4
MYFDKVMREIETALGPLLKELGLRLDLVEYDYYSRVIFTQEPEAEWRSPVQILLPIPMVTGRQELGWEDVRIGCQPVYSMVMGTNGWRGYKVLGLGKDNDEGPAGSGEMGLAAVSKLLAEEEWYPIVRNLPHIPNSQDMIGVWEDLEEALKQSGVGEVTLDRDEAGDETIAFECNGHSVVLRYPARSRTVSVVVDGRVTDTCDSDRYVASNVFAYRIEALAESWDHGL